ncbi:MAG: cupin domain-containing protein [Clostridia bacterium]|nr:cupin domain-containing protein [Clostridia bacterium]
MIEKIYNLTVGNERVTEKVVDDDHVNINHVILNKEEALPIHYANSNAYLAILRGRITVQFNDADTNEYGYGNVIAVPYKTKMNVSNQNDEVLEFFVFKSPNPRHYEK